MAKSLSELVVEAGLSVVALMVEERERILKKEERSLELKGDTLEWLFHDFLTGILLLIQEERFLPGEFSVERIEKGEGGWELVSRILGEPLDPSRHRLLRDIKAITYHRFSVRELPGNWELVYYVDI
jgi:SHS2 domain-containing protein